MFLLLALGQTGGELAEVRVLPNVVVRLKCRCFFTITVGALVT